MRKIHVPLFVLIAGAAFAVLARPGSPGVRLQRAAMEYSLMLGSGDAHGALALMSPEASCGLSAEFLSNLTGTAVPERFVYNGTDSLGIRMAGRAGEGGTRIIWLSDWKDIQVTHDSAIDNLLGSAVALCRQNALANPEGICPVSGVSYEYDPVTGRVVCPEGHLGQGLIINSNSCAMRRDSVVIELNAFIEAGYGYPASLEEMYTASGGEFGRRGGYRCPENGYKYYELRDGAIYCPFHEESSPVVEVE